MKYPIGIQTFSEIIEQDYVYVDKTALIHQLITQGKWYFLSRPRRFGKSVLVSTLAALFRGEKNLFENLLIRTTDYPFAQHPVIKLEFTKAKILNATSFEAFISEQVTTLAAQHQIPLTSEHFERQFDQLVTGLHGLTGQKVVLLVDEYDKPLLNTLETDQLADVKTSMNAFYGVVKALDEHLRFIFITGVSKFSKVSVFSGMNNLDDISMRKDYCALCGYTQQELENYFEQALTSLAATEKKDLETVKAEVKQWYNGYRFHRSGTTVYNPHSILSLCKNQEFDNFWFQSATPTFLIERLKAKQYLLSDLENVYLSPEGLNASEPENTSIQSLFVQTGYLTITSWTGTLYQLDFPNREVRDSFYKSIVEHYAYVEKGIGPIYIEQLVKGFKDKNIEHVFATLKLFFANIPYEITIDLEKYYQSIFFAIFKLLGFLIEAEVRTNKGRIDCVVQTETLIYVLEFKLQGTQDEALQQIKDKQYAQKYQGCGKEVILLGVAFDRQERNIGAWVEESLGP
ncbi:MAG: ATP-binding protein [Candidatus Electrothrix sp. Rat3]|nr:ATP-binding protein [Candidatus Electrothrix rattekaaiensis]